MPRKLTASDRKSLIRLASSLEKGSPERRAILSGLRLAAEFPKDPFSHYGTDPKDLTDEDKSEGYTSGLSVN